jgi:FeS assembly SUF system protein
MNDAIPKMEDANIERSGAPEGLREQIVAALKNIYDPEIPVNIYDLGLIYSLDIDVEGNVKLKMTLTAPGCPVAQTFPQTVESAVEAVPGVKDAEVELVWEPPWSRERMTEAAQLQLGML